MADFVSPGELFCPRCLNGDHLRATHIPANVRKYEFEGDDVTDHFGECCDVECDNCGFQFTYHTEQEA